MNRDQLRAQSARSVLMIRPASFGFNRETAGSNPFQTLPLESVEAVRMRALAEFNNAVAALCRVGVEVVVVEDQAEPATPDAVFPNNWISTHHDGTVVLYPMAAANRRLEQRDDVLDVLDRGHGFRVRRVIDLTPNAGRRRYLEGTGSIVFDHRNRMAYACLSPRTDRGMLYEAQELFGYAFVVFRATDAFGVEVYHTNVAMSIGELFAVVCTEAIDDPSDRNMVVSRLRESGRRIVEVTRTQMSAFAANVLELRGAEAQPVLAVSERGWKAFTDSQQHELGELTRVVVMSVPTIESVGGGSVRCMLAEIFLPKSFLPNQEEPGL